MAKDLGGFEQIDSFPCFLHVSLLYSCQWLEHKPWEGLSLGGLEKRSKRLEKNSGKRSVWLGKKP